MVGERAKMGELFHTEVEVTFIAPEAGGRNRPISSGYHAQIHYEGEDNDWDAILYYGDAFVPFELCVRAFLQYTKPAEHATRVYIGKAFSIREGRQTVANCRVTQILSDLSDPHQ
jgi:translation elongation factor EF-Tu-like GTPase